ncbi:MAG: glycosyl transferase [Parcubacteria group bacterium Gr01-1014_38]|nr:MAG: glycosyl transferase [Parcubacteria group bacterium Gr01-1014_38]
MTVSLVIPAYNEEGRLPTFLEELVTFGRKAPGVLREVLVVDDGSTDRTAAVARMFADLLPLRVIRVPENRGKGAAVRTGVFESHGEVVVFGDADGATAPAELPKLLAALERAPIAVGNRWMPGSRVEGREPFRALSGWMYRTYVSLFGLRDIDTMCGFKGFRRDVARTLFEPLREERWLFDTEIMLRARRRGYAIANVSIHWTSKHGSKLKLPALIRAVFQIPFLAARVASER